MTFYICSKETSPFVPMTEEVLFWDRWAEKAEARGLLAATLFGGFPLADTPAAGLSAICIADGSASAARAATQALLDAAWAKRDE